ncbi:MAG: ABC transporter ATP-binding protein, partial [Clostridia bacterium]|nr:ABC transporter ATP-binding protein [Clostridia bacterium]
MKNNQNKGIIPRLIKTIFGYYPVMLPVTLGCILFSAAVSSVPAIFMQKVLAAVEESWQAANWGSVS